MVSLFGYWLLGQGQKLVEGSEAHSPRFYLDCGHHFLCHVIVCWQNYFSSPMMLNKASLCCSHRFFRIRDVASPNSSTKVPDVWTQKPVRFLSFSNISGKSQQNRSLTSPLFGRDSQLGKYYEKKFTSDVYDVASAAFTSGSRYQGQHYFKPFTDSKCYGVQNLSFRYGFIRDIQRPREYKLVRNPCSICRSIW